MLSLACNFMARWRSISFLALAESGWTSMFCRGSFLNNLASFVLARKSFLDAFKMKLCSETPNMNQPKRSIITLVIPPNFPSRLNHPKIFLLLISKTDYNQKVLQKISFGSATPTLFFWMTKPIERKDPDLLNQFRSWRKLS